MNSAGHKYKSFIYSLTIHLFIALVAISVLYFNKDKTKETYTLVNLQSMHLCAPPAATPLKKVAAVKKVQAPIAKKVSVTKPKPVAKVQKKALVPAPAKKIVELKREPKPVIKEEVAEQKLVEKTPTPLEKEQISEEVTTVLAKAEPKTENSTSVVAPEPSLSYEAQYMQDNLALINALIKQNLAYPRIAQKRGLQGKAVVSFTLDTNGEVKDIKSISQIASILKKSAMKTIRKASVSFPHPKEMLALRIPIVYKLR